jgi:diguanylate cyclase (GGDEF)-like protein/PAS domain S-box-containing protein
MKDGNKAKKQRINELMALRQRISELETSEAQRREMEGKLALFETLINQSNDAIFLVELETSRFSYVNDKASSNLGYTREELLHMGVMDIDVYFHDLSRWRQHVNEIRERGYGVVEGLQKRKDGTTLPVEVNIKFVSLDNKNYLVSVARDISERKRAEQELRESSRQLAEAQKVGKIGSWEWDIVRNNVTWSDEVYRLFGLNPQELCATYEAFLSFVHPDDRKFLDDAVKRAVHKEEPYTLDARMFRHDGTQWIMHARGEVIHDELGHPILMRGILQDVTDQKRLEEELRALSLTDELTGLYNRRGFFTFTEQLLKLAKRQKKGLFMLYADMDNLKVINDTLGHQAGDLALSDIANILRATYRETDIVGRIGGDELAVIPVGTTGDNIEEMIARLERNIGNHNATKKRNYTLSMSLGISYYDPESPCSVDELISRADKKMYERKKLKQKQES